MTTNFNIEPYYDDYDKHKHFHKILYRPGYSVQARELTQMQSILQDQIARLGNHLFKNGTMVIPGELSIDTEFHYVKVNPTFSSTDVSTYVDNLVGAILVGGTSGVKAQVVLVTHATDTDPVTLYVKYTDNGTNNSTISFNNGETLTPEDVNLAAFQLQTIVTGACGLGSGAIVKEGVYYINGHFVLCEPQTIVLDKYTNTPTYSVGFNVVESLVTPEVDETLLDNAQGSYNFAAPGAHRYEIYLQLTKRADLEALTGDSYIQIVALQDGIPQNPFNQTSYAELSKVMARRTYDESGDYVVRDFKYEMREHRNNNRGVWNAATVYLQDDLVKVNNNYYVAETSGTSGNLGISGTWPSDELTQFNDGGVLWRFASMPAFNNGVYTPEMGGDDALLAMAVEPGKAYVRGYEVEKVATTFVMLNKSRNFRRVANSSVNALVGNYVLVTNAHGLPALGSMPEVKLYNTLTSSGGSPAGTLIGTARVRAMLLNSGTIGVSTATYKLSLFNVKMKTGYDFARDVKQFYINGGSTAASFTADVNPVLVELPGTVTASTSTLTGTGTLFTKLKQNDVISINGSLYKITATPSTNSTASISPNLTLTVGAKFYLVTTAISEPEGSNLLFKADDAVMSMRNANGDNVINYTAVHVLTGTTNGSGVVTFNSPGGAGNTNTFASPAGIGNYIGSYGDGVIVDLSGAVTLSNVDQTATVNFGVGVANQSVTVYATIQKSGAIGTEKAKVLTYASYELTTQATGTAKTIVLPNADGRRICSIMMKTGSWASPTGVYGIDISSRFLFDDGQTDSYYDRCKIILAEGQKAPTAPFKVIYEYFEHTGTGDYFTRDSYSVPYKSIPFYGNIALTDVFDFRPRISDNGVSFDGVGSSPAYMPKRGNNITYSHSYYLSRVDKLCVEPDGVFHILQGVPDVRPVAPETSPTGMLLNIISVAPYTHSPKMTRVQSIDNRRYTMRDIGKLEQRINNLEYYTSLSLTEQSTSNMSILDANGLNRYKNGFIVDSFNGHGVGNAQAPDYLCAIDSDDKVLRPYFSMKNITLYESSTSNRSSNNYTMTGDLITLPYSHVVAINQPFASRTENVNPFAVFTFLGRALLNPEQDDWFETVRLPDITVNVEGNYNTLLNQYASSGQLGTVWNAWQTTWVGKPYAQSSTTSYSTSGGQQSTSVANVNAGNWWSWQTYQNTYLNTSAKYQTATTVTTYGTLTARERTGVNTTVTPVIDTKLTNDKLTKNVVIPYMRSRNVAFLIEGLKSNTRLYSAFDNIPVDEYITPATKMTLNNVTGYSNVYDYESNAGSYSTHTARWVDNKLDLSLNKGHILVGQSSGATAIVLYQEPVISGATFVNLYVINVKGTFAAGEVIIGSLNGGTSGPRGTLSSALSVNSIGTALKTNYAGVACGLFMIPNSDKVKFRTGDRELSFGDTTGTASTTSAFANYSATGLQDQWQATYTATRNAKVTQTAVSESGTTVVQSKGASSVTTMIAAATSQKVGSRLISSGRRWSDPLAQTFMVNQPGGAFVTKVDLYFSSKETKLSTPVHIEIREVVNGMPAAGVLPFSQVYKDPANVYTSATGLTPTTFVFPSPVYLNADTEYALVVLSDSNNYNLFISQMGETDIATNSMISTQPYLGVLFKSSNGSTWTENQLQDMKFKMYRASFNTSVTGYVNFSNGPTQVKTLPANPFKITNGSGVIRVHHPAHDMPVTSKVTFAGATAVGNIAAGTLNATHTISNVDLDSYTITVGTTATSTTVGGGSAVNATENLQYDTMHVATRSIVLPNTGVEWQVKTTSGQSVDGSENAYVKDTNWSTLKTDDNVNFTSPRMVASDINSSTFMANKTSLDVMATLTSTMENISPVIDTQRLSAITVSNRVNYPTLYNVNVNGIDDRTVLSVANVVGFNSTNNSIYVNLTDATNYPLMKTLSPGKYVNISGDVTNVPTTHNANNGDFLIIGTLDDGTYYHVLLQGTINTVAPNTSNTITLVEHERFIDETAPMFGSAYNKYISREVILTQPSTFIKTTLAATIPPNAAVELYYKTNPIGDADPIATKMWIKAEPTNTVQYTTSGIYSDISYDIENIPTFDTMQVKIVLKSASSSQVPMCKDLRIIACA